MFGKVVEIPQKKKQHRSTPDNYVVATDEAHSVQEFVEKAFSEAGLDIIWDGEGKNEVGRDSASGKILVRVDPHYFRPTEVDYLLGDPSRAQNKLDWTPKIHFDELVALMVQADLKQAQKDQLVKSSGYTIYEHNE